MPEATVTRRVLTLVDAPAAGFSLRGIGGAGLVAVTPDGNGIAEALVEELQGLGIEAGVGEALPPEADAVVFMGGLSPDAGPGRTLDVHRDALFAAQAVAPGGTFVTVQDTGGDFGLAADPQERAWLGGLPGLVKTAALEWPEAALKAIDIECGERDPRALARTLVAELLEGGPEIEVGLSEDGRRVTLALEAVPATEDGAAPLAEGDVVVVSGGARGVAAAAIEALARVHRPRFVLLGRTALADEPAACRAATEEGALKRALLELAQTQGRDISPAELGREAQEVLAVREIRATMERLTATGSEARYIPVDVRDPAAVAAALDAVRKEWGPVACVIHAAGVLADKRIEDKTAEQLERVFSTKVLGLHALLAATDADPVKAICLFSSVAGRHGNAGQSDYAMANEVLNKVAQAEARRRGTACVVKSVNWGPWDGGMVNAALKAHFTARGIPLIPLEAGAAFLVRELGQASAGEVEIVAAAGPEEANRGRDWRMEVVVGPESHPFLLDHAINGAPVLPVVLVIEWFMRAARAVLPGFEPVALRDIHVLQGVVLDRFSEGVRFAIEARVDGTRRVELRLVSSDGRPHYRGEAEMADAGQRPSAPSAKAAENHAGDWPWSPAEAYDDGRLFHGPGFHVISDLEGVSSEGGVGVVDGVLVKEWAGGPWSTDPAALDGGLQLALLWALKHTGRVFLPARIGTFVPYDRLPAGEALRCRFTSRLIGHHRTENDMTFATSDGHVVAELQGLEMYPMDSKSQPSDSEDAA